MCKRRSNDSAAGRPTAVVVRIDAERGAAPIDMGMQIDQSGRHDGAGHLANVARFGRKARSDARDFAVGEGHIGHGIELLRGVDHSAAAQNEVVGHGTVPPTIGSTAAARSEAFVRSCAHKGSDQAG